MRLVMGSDHGGFGLKEKLKEALVGMGVDVTDVGTNSLASVDYPDLADAVAVRVASGQFERGILVCGTGIGMSIAANKVAGVRAALVHDITTARLAAAHNNANVLCLGGRLLAPEIATEIVQAWLETPFESRHQRRLDKIAAMETVR